MKRKFTGLTDVNLPRAALDLPVNARGVWISAYNAAIDRDLEEAQALTEAQGVINAARSVLGLAESAWDYEYTPGAEQAASTLDSVPTNIAAMLPSEARNIWLEAYNLCVILGGPEWKCRDAGWAAVSAAGYAPDDLPKYVKVGESENGKEDPITPPSPRPFTEAFTDADTLFVEAQESNGTGAIWDVVLIRAGRSLNKRRYTESVLRQAVPLFEGAKACADHDNPRTSGGARSVREVVGYYSHVAWNESLKAITGHLHVLESASWLRSMLKDITQPGVPKIIGLSINAEGTEKLINESGTFLNDVTHISRVRSCDVVTEPAAGGVVVRLVASTDSESYQEGRTAMHPRLQRLIESLSGPAQDNMRTFCESLDTLGQAAFAASLDRSADPVTPPNPAPANADPAPTPTPAVDTATAALTEEVTTLRTQMRAFQMQGTRAYAATALTESRLPELAQTQIRTNLEALFGRRDVVENSEIDAMIKEAKDIWAAFEQHAGTGAVRGVPGSSASRLHTGSANRDQLVAAIDGMLENVDQELDGAKVRRFRSFKEAFCAWTGHHAFDTDGIIMMRESQNHAGYDSHIHGDLLQEAMTTASWGQIFSDRMYRRMMKEYNLQPLDIWRQLVSAVESVPDFRSQRRDRLGGYGLLETVGEAQTYPYLVSPEDEEVTYAVSKRGGLDDITFEMIQNDDLRNIRTIPVKLARAAYQTLFRFVMDMVRDFSTAVYDGTPLYHATHNNLQTAALSDGALTTQWQAMRSQVAYGNATEVLGTRPRFLLVPNELEQLATKLTQSAVTILGANFNATEPNFYQNKLTPIIVDYWTDPNDWFMVADPSQNNTIEIGFLDGREEPELFVQDQPNVGAVMTADKITYKVRHIYSGTVLDWRSFAGNQVA